MGSTFRYLASDEEAASLLSWFSGLAERPHVEPTPRGASLVFASDADAPRVNIFLPCTIRGVLRTAGEVHFIGRSKGSTLLAKVSQRFRRHLKQFTVVFPTHDERWDYYLEGTLRNYDAPIVALPAALAELDAGIRYFIADGESPSRVEELCRSLRLRAIVCAPN